MNIVILNGNPEAGNAGFETYLGKLSQALHGAGHEVSLLTLREMKIEHCRGCWGCWVKTPGECLAQDDSAEICRKVIHGDILVFASPIIMGFTSALLKRAHDKFIPLIHPYTTIYQGEIHHVARYPKAPKMALLLATEPDTDAEDLAIIEQIYRRNAINFHTSLACVKIVSEPVEEVAHALGNL